MFQVSSFASIMFQVLSFKFQENRGQLLIEAMVGIGIVMVGLLGIVSLISRSASLNRVVSNQLIATYLASEGIEITKNFIDNNIIQFNPWNSGLTTAGRFNVDYKSSNLQDVPFEENRALLLDSNTGFYSYQQIGNPTPFVRIINIGLIGSDEIKVNSVVNWTDRGGAQFEVNLEDHFFNWRP